MQIIREFLERYKGKRIALATHVRPDGDAIGSCLGLADALSRHGWQAAAVVPLAPPPYLAFLTAQDMAARLVIAPESDWYENFDVMGVLDCGEEGRLDPSNRPALSVLPTFTIDHHESSLGLGEARWIEPSASSTGEMVVRFCKESGWTVSPGGAMALWTAIVTDTGRFSYENTVAATLDAAKWCIESGARPPEAAEHLYQSVSPSERRLQTMVLERMELYESGRLAISWLKREDFHRAGSTVEDTQNLVSLLRDTAGVNAAIFLYEPEGSDSVKASFRTRAPLNCLDVVCRFGGGGHLRAAGCTLPGPMERARATILDAARTTFFHADQDTAHSS